jgi:hypothetical protein
MSAIHGFESEKRIILRTGNAQAMLDAAARFLQRHGAGSATK